MFDKAEKRVVNSWLDNKSDFCENYNVCFYTDGKTLRLKTPKNNHSIGHTGYGGRKEFHSYDGWGGVELIVYDYTKIIKKMMKKDNRIIDTEKEIEEEMKRRYLEVIK